MQGGSTNNFFTSIALSSFTMCQKKWSYISISLSGFKANCDTWSKSPYIHKKETQIMWGGWDSTGSLFVTCNLIQKLEKGQPFKRTLKWSYSPAVQLLQYSQSTARFQMVCLRKLSRGTIHQALLTHTKGPPALIISLAMQTPMEEWGQGKTLLLSCLLCLVRNALTCL